MKFLYILFFILFLQNNALQVDDKALVIVPVADLAFNSIEKQNKNVQSIYDSFCYAYSWDKSSFLRCHQLLFNELVKIKTVLNYEVEVELSNIFCHCDGQKMSNFWVLKNNLLFLKDLPSAQYLKTIPALNLEVLTLIFPHQDPKTKIIFSAGTQFVHLKNEDDEKNYTVIFINPKTLKTEKIKIEKEAAISQTSPNFGSINLFVSILKKWANMKDGFIPYVWGGTSFCKIHSENKFDLICQEDSCYWCRPELEKIITGLDCSGLIFRAAQIAGLKYFFKNTFTLSVFLKPLTENEKIKNGYLIYHEGHVMVISDVKRNKLIESCGYCVGYGKVHELPLNKVFKDIENFEQLKKAFFNNEPLIRLDSKGEIFREIKKFKILKME
ncbi:hypothetical protein M1446_03290 [Candidatus Dependentiae bacterium]|nr:hypothetical protein [Candidatus Dependentiae bacterium]